MKEEEISESEALAVEVVEQEVEELPEKLEIDHSKLYVWVTDSGNDRIQKFNGNGKLLMQFGKSAGLRPPYEPGELKTPSGVTVDKESYIWVADTGCHRVQKFDSKGNYILSFGSEGWGQDKFYWPEDIIAEPTGTILVVDTSNHCLKRYDDEGEFLLSFGFAGNFDGFLKFPTGVALDKEGKIYVADRDNQ